MRGKASHEVVHLLPGMISMPCCHSPRTCGSAFAPVVTEQCTPVTFSIGIAAIGMRIDP